MATVLIKSVLYCRLLNAVGLWAVSVLLCKTRAPEGGYHAATMCRVVEMYHTICVKQKCILVPSMSLVRAALDDNHNRGKERCVTKHSPD
jgi:hypothetical protein